MPHHPSPLDSEFSGASYGGVAQQPPPSFDGQNASIEAELYHQYAREAAEAAQPSRPGPSWSSRKAPGSILAAAAVLLVLLDALCGTTPDIASFLFAYSWTIQSGSRTVTVVIGVFTRIKDREAAAISEGSWGGPTSATYLQTWFFCQIALLATVVLASLGVAFAPHPHDDNRLTMYRHLLRASILLALALTGTSWSILATLASSQSQPKIGYFAVSGQSLVVAAAGFGLFLASRLERDEDWQFEWAERQEAKRDAKSQDRRRRAEFQQQKTIAIAMAKQRRTENKVVAQALGREGARALLLNQMMSAGKPKAGAGANASQVGASQAFSGYTGYGQTPQQAAPPWGWPQPQPFGYY